jgi:hypothetical protein
MGENFGFKVAKGCVLKTLEPIPEAVQVKNSQEIQKAAARFYRELVRNGLPVPSFFRLMMFRISRTSIKGMLNNDYCDYRHYREKGWFESEYYYPLALGPLKRLVGQFSDLLGRQMIKGGN